MRMRTCLLAVFITIALAQAEEKNVIFALTSPAFEPGGSIPVRFTCEGANVSPPLAWNGIPNGTQSLALIVDDPDAPDPAAPRMTWVHWILYNLPPAAKGIPEGVALSSLPAGTRPGTNDFMTTLYGGPCPPVGRHRYFHKLYALDVVLPDLGKPRKGDLERAMKGHVLGVAQIMGTFQKSR